MDQLELDRLHQLADFLRNRRARLSPEEVGVPRGTRRRTPGLRREEVASLAGVSPEWYTRLEQGRDIHVSVQVLESLARVLHLDANERDHLFLLALKQPPPIESFTHSTISPTLQQFLDQLGTTPACVVDPRLTVISWNAAYSVIYDYHTSMSERERNLIWRFFTAPLQPMGSKEWEQLVRVYLAQFRAGYGRFSDDPWWAAEIAELSRVSPKFKELWARQDVLNVTEGRKVMHHPLAGKLSFDFLLLQTVDTSDLRLLIHIPQPNTQTADRIKWLMDVHAGQSSYNQCTVTLSTNP